MSAPTGSNRQSTVLLQYPSSKRGAGFPIVQDEIVLAGGLSYMDTSRHAFKNWKSDCHGWKFTEEHLSYTYFSGRGPESYPPPDGEGEGGNDGDNESEESVV